MKYITLHGKRFAVNTIFKCGCGCGGNFQVTSASWEIEKYPIRAIYVNNDVRPRKLTTEFVSLFEVTAPAITNATIIYDPVQLSIRSLITSKFV